MKVHVPMCAVVGIGLSVSCAWGQAARSTLPGTAPTTQPVAAAAVQASPMRQVNSAKKAHVTWAQGALTISAENASLNQILAEITRQTGMKITGGVTEERVYGEYGPGAPGAVLASLLLGTGSNMLLKENAANGPVELVLSPRTGGATPPGPLTYARVGESQDDLPPQQQVPRPRARGGSEPVQPPSAATGAAQPGAVAAPASSAVGQTAVTAATGTGGDAAAGSLGTTDQQSPNGVKTPQQIYDQLIKMQQQKAAAQAAQQHPAAALPQ